MRDVVLSPGADVLSPVRDTRARAAHELVEDRVRHKGDVGGPSLFGG